MTLNSGRPRSPFRRICLSAADVVRRSRQRSENGVLKAVPNPGDPSLDGAVEEVLEAVERLPERLRQVVLNHYCDGMSVRQIAEASGSPVGTITKYLSRARVMLRKLLLENSS